ncbi:hypothetical protein [Ruegeria intermedia]|nr:hypothetical protein [Ruegeria intermedia]
MEHQDTTAFFSQELRERIMQRYAEQNAEFARLFLSEREAEILLRPVK